MSFIFNACSLNICSFKYRLIFLFCLYVLLVCVFLLLFVICYFLLGPWHTINNLGLFFCFGPFLKPNSKPNVQPIFELNLNPILAQIWPKQQPNSCWSHVGPSSFFFLSCEAPLASPSTCVFSPFLPAMLPLTLVEACSHLHEL